MSTPEQQPFKLVSTNELRQRERTIWKEFPQEISQRWLDEEAQEIAQQQAIIVTAQNDLKQVKEHHKLAQQKGNLYYPSTYEAIKTTLNQKQQDLDTLSKPIQ
jgi:chaperonin cofactor prefoldin